MTSPRGLWKDRAILRAAGGILEPEWYVRFGRRQLLTDWMNEHTREQVAEMYASTALHEYIPLRILDLFPVVEPRRIRAARAFLPNDLQESDVKSLRDLLDHRAKMEGLQVEPEFVRLDVRVEPGYSILLAFSAIAR